MPSKRALQSGGFGSSPDGSPIKKPRILETIAGEFFDEEAYRAQRASSRRFDQNGLLHRSESERSMRPLNASLRDRQRLSSTDSLDVTEKKSGPIPIPKDGLITLKLNTTSASLGNVVERTLGRHLEELSNDTEHWTRTCLRRARLGTTETPAASSSQDEMYSFDDFKPIQVSQTLKPTRMTRSVATFTHEKGKQKQSFSVPVTFFTTDDFMPEYAHHVNVKNNFLSPNDVVMRCWPYFNDDFDMETMAENLRSQYHLDIAQRRRKLVRLLQAEKYEHYVKCALDDLKITWADVLTFLLDASCDVGKNSDAITASSKRRSYCEEDFPSRSSTRTVTVLSSLPKSSTDRLAKAACLCENFQRLTHFPLWHVVRRHIFDYMPKPEISTHDLQERFNCKICMRFHCEYHGEINQYENSDSEDDSHTSEKVDSAIEEDIVNPPNHNFRTHVEHDKGLEMTDYSAEDAHKNGSKRTGGHGQNHFVWEPDKRKPFYPCHHPGSSCEDANCSCFKQKIHCEKFCSCDKNCARRWTGCNCTSERVVGGTRTMCFADERCNCYKHARECDPDLCGSCHVHEVLHPKNRFNNSILTGRCRNASIQRAVPKHTVLGQSNIHGFGLYAGEDVRNNDFVGEYKGEIITAQEAERRGAVYEHQKLSYLFCLNQTQEIDSTYFGNKIRFINHARESKANIYARIMLVNTVHRIALYASRQIRKGTELFFDYGPKFPQDQLGGGEEEDKKAAAKPRVRNSKVVLEEFHDVEVTEDEHGNRRAHKSTGKGRGRKSAKTSPSPKSKAKSKPQPKPQPKPKPAMSRRRRRIIDDDEESPEEPEPVKDKPNGPDEDQWWLDNSAEQRLAAYNICDDGPGADQEAEYETPHVQDLDNDEYQQDEEAASEDEDESENSYLRRAPRLATRVSRTSSLKRVM